MGGFGGARSTEVEARLGGALARLPPAGPDRAAVGRAALGGAASRRARRRDRPGPRLRHRRSRRPPASAWSCCSSRPAASLLDVGCGSGVLSIAAAKLGFGPVLAIDIDPPAVEATERERGRERGRGLRPARGRLTEPLPPADTAVANISLDVDRRSRRARCDRSSPPATWRRSAGPPRLPAREPARGRRLGRRPARPDAGKVLPGWRPSRSTSSAARSRTPTRRRCASGCSPTATPSATAGPTSRSSTPAASRTRRSRSRASSVARARTHDRVYVTGCGANLAGRRVRRPARRTSSSSRRRSEETPGAVAGDVGAIGCVQADARLDRVRAFVKVQDGCSFSCSFCVIPLVRGASRSRRAAAVLAEIRRRVEQGHLEVVLTGINLGCYRDREAGYDLPRLVREAGATPGLATAAPLLDRDQPRHRRRSSPRSARRRPSRGTCTCRSSPATTASCARWAAATTRPRSCAGSSRLPRTST